MSEGGTTSNPAQAGTPGAALPPSSHVSPVPSPLTQEQLAELDQGRRRWKKLRRAVRVAQFSAWTLALIAGVSLLIGIWSKSSAIMGLLFAGVTINEFIGAAKLKRAQYAAPLLLGWNQLLFIAIVGGYCAYNMFLVAHQPSQLAQQLQSPEVSAQLQEAFPSLGFDLEQLSASEKGITDLFYAVTAFGVLVSQGLLSLYYFTRRKHVMTYLKATPAWVVEVQRRSAA